MTMAVTWESHPWRSRAGTQPASRTQRAKIRPEYDAAIPATIATLQVAIEPSVLSAADDARAEISRFDEELSSTLPSSELAPLSAVLLRTESASSSQIENITAGARALALAELGIAKFASNAELVAANVSAMERAVDLADQVSPESILAIHGALMAGQDHADPGSFRDEQVWVGGSGLSPHGAQFVPPHHSRVVVAIDDLCAFAARTDVPLLAQVAIAHAQFETIHPFLDGNGRTGRALVHAMLRHAGATTRATVPVSAGLLADTAGYFAALTSFREGDPNPIVAAFAEAAFVAIANGRQLADDLVAIHEGWSTKITAHRDAAVWRLLPVLLSQPAVTSPRVREVLGLSQPAADAAIFQLRDAGILTQVSGGQRYRAWVATEVTAALDAFAARSRRRH